MPPRDAIAIPMEQRETRAPWMTAAKKKAINFSVGTLATIGLGAWISIRVVPWFMDQQNQTQSAALEQQKAAAIQAAEDRKFTQGKLTELLERSIITGEKQASATNENTRCLESLQDSHEELCTKLDKLIDIQVEAAK